MTKEQANERVKKLEAKANEARKAWRDQFILVDDMESNGEDCKFEKEDLEVLKNELDIIEGWLEDAIDYRDNWC